MLVIQKRKKEKKRKSALVIHVFGVRAVMVQKEGRVGFGQTEKTGNPVLHCSAAARQCSWHPVHADTICQ